MEICLQWSKKLGPAIFKKMLKLKSFRFSKQQYKKFCTYKTFLCLLNSNKSRTRFFAGLGFNHFSVLLQFLLLRHQKLQSKLPAFLILFVFSKKQFRFYLLYSILFSWISNFSVNGVKVTSISHTQEIWGLRLIKMSRHVT